MLNRSQYATQGEFDAALRDYFAAQALSSVIRLQSSVIRRHSALPDEVEIEDCIAVVAYRLADAMLKERAR